jgi:hypothetical protein
MIRDIIKNRRKIITGVGMVSVVYAAIFIHTARLVYGKNRTVGRDY